MRLAWSRETSHAPAFAAGSSPALAADAGGVWDEDRFHWWKVFRTLWWGIGMARQGRQHLDGTFRSIIMAASGRRVAELEWDALCLIEGR